MSRSLPDGCVGKGIPGKGNRLWKNHKGINQLGTLFIVWSAVNSCCMENSEGREKQCRAKLLGQKVPS